MIKLRYILLFFIISCFNAVTAQTDPEVNSGISDTIEYIKDNDTIKEIIIEEVLVDASNARLTKEEREQIKLLQRRVRVVYPYAKMTADKITHINQTLAKLKTEKEKKKYLKLAEKFLTDEFEPRLKKLSQKQGQILIKLIYRQTGQTTFDLIKDYRSGWKAFWSNNTARIFNMNLKKEYKPLEVAEDYYIEKYLLECFEENKLPYQKAAHPVSEDELYAAWVKRNNEKVQQIND